MTGRAFICILCCSLICIMCYGCKAPSARTQATEQQAASQPGIREEEAPSAPSREAAPSAAERDKQAGQQASRPLPEADSPGVLVNKRHGLPPGYAPRDLIFPKVRTLTGMKSKRYLLRREAAQALERLFAAAEREDIYLASVSAYRSSAAQAAVYGQYVHTEGSRRASSYSAAPGHSEHETGLAVDLSGSDGRCAVQDCFADTKEAKWLAKHGHRFGYIIRYPRGKEEITGYQYEPWHLRYVGRELAGRLAAEGITLEEYYGVDNGEGE
ncbi:M15 family metallopeptidase [Paenibacillus thiaminolyticus]|uniref:M15 family metallopeptidase n=1 Tax=Paenibacillus thiaminolyticus TaxID=49283 RepID=UPI00232E39D4|nr:M15 family metallopeptidase [Paenibacillus thiaminolyticus]WCF05722.1 M15 family metallopeptidase [Paenibacillus thiaminolyticus]